MTLNFSPIENYLPIVRAVVTETKPRPYQSAAGISQLVAEIAARVTTNARVFLVEADSVLIGFAIVKWLTAHQRDVDFMLLRNTPASAYASVQAALLAEADNHAPLYIA